MRILCEGKGGGSGRWIGTRKWITDGVSELDLGLLEWLGSDPVLIFDVGFLSEMGVHLLGMI